MITSIYSGAFSTSSLEKELVQALEEDRLHKKTEAMKKKAIVSAKDYDEFKNLVACADLKPVSQKDLENIAKSERRRNMTYWKSLQPKETTSGKSFDLVTPSDRPKKSVEFKQIWKRHCLGYEQKYRYLKLCGAQHLSKLFKREIDSFLVEEIIDTFDDKWKEMSQNNVPNVTDATDEMDFMLAILDSITSVERFNLMLSFIDSKHKTTLSSTLEGFVNFVAGYITEFESILRGQEATPEQSEELSPNKSAVNSSQKMLTLSSKIHRTRELFNI